MISGTELPSLSHSPNPLKIPLPQLASPAALGNSPFCCAAGCSGVSGRRGGSFISFSTRAESAEVSCLEGRPRAWSWVSAVFSMARQRRFYMDHGRGQEGSYMTRIGSAWPLARRLPEDTVPSLKMPSMYLLNVPTVDDQGGSCLTVYASKNGCDNRR